MFGIVLCVIDLHLLEDIIADFVIYVFVILIITAHGCQTALDYEITVISSGFWCLG